MVASWGKLAHSQRGFADPGGKRNFNGTSPLS
jgi:hypothetical protein